MKIRHPALKTSLLKLVSTYETDLNLGPELSFPLRIEIFKDTERNGWFRAHVWELEYFDLKPTFPVKTKSGKSKRYRTTELLMLERITQLTGNYDAFKAKNEADALAKLVDDLKTRLAHWTGIKAR